MKILFLSFFFILASCSGGGGGSDSAVTASMSASQKQAQELIKSEIQPLQSGQYEISDEDMALLKKEGLISQKEMNSLNVVK